MWERAYFVLCRGLGKLLRSSTYSAVRVVDHGDGPIVQKRRRFYAPLLVALSDPLIAVLNTGVRVLHQRDWEERERALYRDVYGLSIDVDADGTLILPHLRGQTLAATLEDAALGDTARASAIKVAVTALAAFHAKGFTHGDAMAENVMVDREAGVARWFDFETAHEESRSMAWRRTDDVRALLATCLLRIRRGSLAETLELILDTYADDEIARLAGMSFAAVWQRPLTFHLGQAPLSYKRFREISRLLRERFAH